MLVIPPELRQWRFAFVVVAPQNFTHSNGIRVLLDAAVTARSLGIDVCIVPVENEFRSYNALPAPYASLPISWEIPRGCCALLGDTLTDELLSDTRSRADRICHYSLAPNGLFQCEGLFGNRLFLHEGERQVVYSPQISTKFPFFYLQSNFIELEPWIQSTRKTRRPLLRQDQGRTLKACIYPGKGHIKELPIELRRRIRRSGSQLITRCYPRSKRKLYRYLSEADLLVSFDPLSSLSYEATLLGIPSFILPQWDEHHFRDHFPVRLDGIIWNDLLAFLRLLDNGFDYEAVLSSYRDAIARNPQVIVELLSYASGLQQAQPFSAADLNSYWQSRQPFFAQLNMPSPPEAWGPLSVALLPLTPLDRLQDFSLNAIRRFLQRCHRFAKRLRDAVRRLRA